MRDRVTTTFAAGLVIAVFTASLVFAAQQLTLGEHAFDWTTIEQDRAHFVWNADVVNESSAAFEVTVTVDLLDDDDATVGSRDDCQVRGASAATSVAPGQTRTVRNEGSLPFDCAADVVSFRFRLDPAPSQSP
jgi:hypothetical protein